MIFPPECVEKCGQGRAIAGKGGSTNWFTKGRKNYGEVQTGERRRHSYCDQGVWFCAAKTCVVLSCQQWTLHPPPKLFLPVQITVQFLGLLFDSKLTWGTHAAIVDLCLQKLNILRFLCGTTWGADSTVLLLFY